MFHILGAESVLESWQAGMKDETSTRGECGCLLFFFKDFIYLFMRDTERERQREKQAPCREPDMGLDPGSPESHPGPKVALNH